MRARITMAAVGLAALPLMLSGAWAANVPATPYNSGNASHEAEPPKAPVQSPQEVPVIPSLEEEPLSIPEGSTLHVSGFRLEGVAPADEAEVSALLAPYRDRDLTLAEIYQAAGKVTAFYRARGFMVAKAYVPKQDASSGLLLLKVLIGTYGEIKVNNNSHVRDFLVEGTVENAMQPGQPVDRADVERGMLLTSDLPGSGMPKIAISKGGKPGTTDFTVDVPSKPYVDGYLLGDNYGSIYTGTYRLLGGVDLNSPLGLGDKLSFSGKTTDGNGERDSRAAYSFPLSYSGLRLEVAASHTSYELQSVYRYLNALGTADTLEGTLSYPVIRSVAENLQVSFNFANKHLKDEALGSEIDSKRSNAGTLSLQNRTTGSLLGMRLTTSAMAGLEHGYLDFPIPSEESSNQAGANTDGRFSKATFGTSAQVELDKSWTFAVALSGQKSLMGKNLDGSEQFSISGPDGVRAYYDGTMGDTGYLASGSLKYALPQLDALKHSVGIFADSGRVLIQNNNYGSATQRSGTSLKDVGAGYYANFDYWDGRYLVTSIEATLGLGSKEETASSSARAKILAQVGVTF